MHGRVDGALTFEYSVERRQHEQGEKRRADETTDHHSGQRFLDLAARSSGEEHRHEAKRGHAGGDEHGPQP